MRQYVVHRASPAVVARPPQEACEGPVVLRTTDVGQQSVQAADVSSPAEAAALPDPRRMFHAARELLAKSGKDNPPGRRKRKKVTSIPGARLEHLMCFIDNNRLQKDMHTVVDVCDQQAWELLDINHSRGEDVVKLSLDAVAVKSMMQEPADDLLMGCGCCGDIKTASKKSGQVDENRMLEETLSKRRLLIDNLKNQVEAQGAELSKAREGAEEAQVIAASEDAKLNLLTETHREEVSEIRRRLCLDDSFVEVLGLTAPDGLGDAFGMLPFAVGNAQRRLVLAGRLRVQEAQKLLERERCLHCEEVEALRREIQATSVAIAAKDGLSPDAAAFALTRSQAARQELRQCCEELSRAMSSFLVSRKQPTLPQVPGSDDDLAAWLETLTSRLSSLSLVDETPNG